MPTRINRETLYLRHDFTADEKLTMGSDLAGAYNRLQEIEEEESAIKAQIKERKAQVELKVGSLSRNLANGWEMRNVECTLKYDFPNVGEVTYLDGTGKEVKARPMTETERQMDLPLAEPKTEAEAEASAEKSADNIEGFFKGKDSGGEEEPEQDPDQEPSEGDEDEEEEEFATAASPAKKSGPAELKAFHEKEVEKESKRGRKKATSEPF